MSTDVLGRQMNEVAWHIRICSDHQRSLVQILRGSVTVAAPVVDPDAPTLVGGAWIPTAAVISSSPDVLDPFRVFYSPTTQAPASPFDDLLAAVAHPKGRRPVRVGPLPPRSRFMMRVAPVDRPHRATKRNYDYFQELKAALEALADKDPTDRG